MQTASETIIINGLSIQLKAGESKSINLHRAVFPEKLIIVIDFSLRAGSRQPKSVSVRPKNVLGDVLGNEIKLVNKEKAVKRRLDKSLGFQPYKCSQIELTAENDVSFTLTIIEVNGFAT